MPETLPFTSEEKGVIARFKEAAREFTQVNTQLAKQRAWIATQAPEVQARYRALMQRGQIIRGTIEKAARAIDKVANAYRGVKTWLSRTFGLDGIPLDVEASRRLREGDQLGAVFIVAVAVTAASASLAAITKWVTDARAENRRFAEMRRLESEGMTPRQAAEVINRVTDRESGFFSGTVGKLALPVLLIAGAAIVLPMLQPQEDA